MRTFTAHLSYPALIALLVAGSLSCGCATMDSLQDVGALVQPDESVVGTVPDGAPTVRVALVRREKAIRTVDVPYEDGMLVQQALEKAGAIKKFRRMRVQVARRSANGEWLKMGVAFDSSKREVPSGSNYALYPGDRVLATEDSSTVIGDMLRGVVPEKFAGS